ncbi:uncharacterized protein N7477_002759 [Penicillium maclennaniae]|uniref:uncharacterized protein n=1 Tax=Penicillium maclennaniae TaxID=1343394 RepID=UPI00253FCC2D|nr:uncharacterized protein N7477_002759 [Penicillium maclennaniae]KAJ5677126.1 hypothetical protein N7477_002759 [Penicillium maclennaniae]
MDVDRSPVQQRTSRKHLRSSSDDTNLTWSSDESGRFDDADERGLEALKSPSAKSAKRRRSNDWPLPDEAADYGHHDRRARNGGGGSGANLATAYKSSPRASPRGSSRARHSTAASNSPRNLLGRRSRFVEATMVDSVSEKPPSIFMQEKKQAAAQNRGSGIFRFGKAIASAFNPFGGWNKSSPENVHKSPQKDALVQAEQAYAELKKAGYQGTNKGAYLESANVNQAHADHAWQDVQENTLSGNPTSHCGETHGLGTPLRSPRRSPTKSSKRSSFQDLRSIGFPFMRPYEQVTTAPPTYQDRSSEDLEQGGLRRQKSKKEINRQAKLVKKVSNLEDKLDRARRELRELSGNEERVPAPIPESTESLHMRMDMDPGSYPRKFVPGALPTLPSERLLDQQNPISKSPEPDMSSITALPSMEGRGSFSLEEPLRSPSSSPTKTPKGRSKSRPSSMGKENSSRKRKTPVPEPIVSRNPIQPTSTDCHDDILQPPELEQLIDFGLLSPTRQAKWQKFDAGDSPGSVERKRNTGVDYGVAGEIDSMHKRSSSIQPRPSPGLNGSPSPKTGKSPPPLRMRRGHSNLRSVSPTHIVPGSREVSSDCLSPSPPLETHNTFYLQQQRSLDPDRTSRSSSPTKSTSSPSKPAHTRRRSRQEEDIPPVPPLPKELLNDAAKVIRSPSKKEKSRNRGASVLEPRSPSTQNRQSAVLEEYPWPSDMF